MNKLIHDLLLRFVKIMNVVLIAVPFAACWYLYYRGMSEIYYYTRGNMMILFIFVVLYTVFGRIYDAFLISVYRVSEIISVRAAFREL